MGRLPENGVLVGLTIYEYVNPRWRAVRCGSENPGRAFKRLMKIWTLQIQRGGILDSDSKMLYKIMIPTLSVYENWQVLLS